MRGYHKGDGCSYRREHKSYTAILAGRKMAKSMRAPRAIKITARTVCREASKYIHPINYAVRTRPLRTALLIAFHITREDDG